MPCEKCSPWKGFQPWHDWLFFHAFTPRSRTYLFIDDLKPAYVYSCLMCASNFAMPPSHNIKGSYPSFELSIETLQLIEKALEDLRLLDGDIPT